MGKHERGYERVERDFYPTRERWVTEALLAHVDLAGLSVWEPATGEGDMAEVLKTSGAARVYCTDIVARGYQLDALCDFTAAPLPALMREAHIDAVITNPPLGLRNRTAERFIEVGLEHIARGGILALLLPADFDSAARRRPLFDACPWFAGRITLTRRIAWFDRSDGRRVAPKENHSWFLWEHRALRARAAPILRYAPSSPASQPDLAARHHCQVAFRPDDHGIRTMNGRS
jgi:hypothetical protein